MFKEKEIFLGNNHIQAYKIGHYNRSVRIIDLVSHTTYVVCVNFYTEVAGSTVLKVDSKRQIFLRNFSWQFLFTLKVFARNLLRESHRKNICRI